MTIAQLGPTRLEARHWIPAVAGMTIAQLGRHVSTQDTGFPPSRE
jgi:hypothetical protein